MKQTDVIKRAVQLIRASHEFHALIVEGPAGWGKSTAVQEALRAIDVEAIHLGAYSTPLSFYLFLNKHQKSVVLIDDCAGIFGSDLAMSILKAATWPQGKGKPVVKWSSTSNKALVGQFEFRGKLIIVCNTFPTTPDAVAVKSRSFPHKMSITVTEAKKLLTDASRDRRRFPQSETAEQACTYLCSLLNEKILGQISYRTLKLTYEVIQNYPQEWHPLMKQVLRDVPSNPTDLVKKLDSEFEKVKFQEQAFVEKTGLRRRTFYKIRRQLNLSKPYAK